MKAIGRIETKQNYQVIKEDALERFADAKYSYECLAILIGLDTGLRVSDLLKLKVEDIKYNEDKNRFECVSDIKKTGVSNHKTLLSSDTYKALKSLNITEGYIFINPKTNKFFTREWLSKRSKLRYGFSFHTMRKISAKRMLEVGTLADAQRHLAHSKIASTNTYLKVGEQDSLDRISSLYS
jgi:integrase